MNQIVDNAIGGYEEQESAGDFALRVGVDGALWAKELHKRFPAIPEDDALGWCCNMIMAGYDHARGVPINGDHAQFLLYKGNPTPAVDGDAVRRVAKTIEGRIHHMDEVSVNGTEAEWIETMERLARDVIKAATQQPANGWRDISEHDANNERPFQVIDMNNENAKIPITAFWSSAEGAWCFDDGENCYLPNAVCDPYTFSPTHFRELPLPPTSQGEPNA